MTTNHDWEGRVIKDFQAELKAASRGGANEVRQQIADRWGQWADTTFNKGLSADEIQSLFWDALEESRKADVPHEAPPPIRGATKIKSKLLEIWPELGIKITQIQHGEAEPDDNTLLLDEVASLITKQQAVFWPSTEESLTPTTVKTIHMEITPKTD